MEKSTPLGLIAGCGLIFGAIFLGSGWLTFFDPASLVLVVGGTAAALVVNYSLDDLGKVPDGVKGIFSFAPPPPNHYIDLLADLAGTARREGLLALDRQLDDLDDEMMQYGLEMTIDGIEAEEIAEMLDQRIAEEMQQRELMPRFFMTAGTYAPAFGMVGTLIGLIQMLQNLNDPTQIGAGMATALVTTFYGAFLANLVFLPMGNKARAQARHNAKLRFIVREGILSIARGDSPRMIEQRLGFYKLEEAALETESAEGVADPQAAGAPAMAGAAAT